jgi:protein TonB
MNPSRPSNSRVLLVCGLLAILLHAGVLALRSSSGPISLITEGDSIEVALVDSVKSDGPPTPPAVEPQTPPPPQPQEEKEVPKEPEKKEELPLPEPDTNPEPEIKELPAPKPPAPPRKPAQSSPAPSTKSVVARPSAPPKGSAGGSPQSGNGAPEGAPTQFAYRPRPVYPTASRGASKEEGTVLIRMVVNADGRPISVSVAQSSGFPRLDRSATEAAWRCKVRNAVPGKPLTVPIKFELQD